jgi:hypothetical protein
MVVQWGAGFASALPMAKVRQRSGRERDDPTSVRECGTVLLADPDRLTALASAKAP